MAHDSERVSRVHMSFRSIACVTALLVCCSLTLADNDYEAKWMSKTPSWLHSVSTQLRNDSPGTLMLDGHDSTSFAFNVLHDTDWVIFDFGTYHHFSKFRYYCPVSDQSCPRSLEVQVPLGSPEDIEEAEWDWVAKWTEATERIGWHESGRFRDFPGDGVRYVRLFVTGNFGSMLSTEIGEVAFYGYPVNGWPPVINGDDFDFIVNDGTDVSLFVDVMGSPPFTYAWHFNGLLVTYEDQATFNFPATKDREGEYYCVVSNRGGETKGPLFKVSLNDVDEFDAIPSIPWPGWLGQSLYQHRDDVEANRVASGGQDPQPSIDGDMNSATIFPTESENWLIYDLSSCHHISGFRLWMDQQGCLDCPQWVSLHIPLSQDAALSSDFPPEETKWSRVLYETTMNTAGGWFDFGAFGPYLSRYWKLGVNNNWGNNASTRLVEIEFSGSPCKAAPVITTRIQSFTAEIGDQIALQVESKGIPTPSLRWERDGVPIPSISDILDNTSKSSINILSFDGQFQGTYTCIASNIAGEALSFPIVIDANTGPTFLEDICGDDCVEYLTLHQHNSRASGIAPHESDVVWVSPGKPLVLEAKVYGNLPMTYNWRKNGESMNTNQSVQKKLSIPSLGSQHTGTYDVVVANNNGSVVSLPIHIEVAVPPIFLTQPQPITITAGEAFTLFVKVEPNPLDPTYQWYRNDLALVGETEFALTVVGATEDDGGDYYCAVRNAAGVVFSEQAAVIVGAPPRIVFGPPYPVFMADKGQTVNFTVLVESSWPVWFMWSKNGVPVPGADEATLLIPHVGWSDTASYICLVGNWAGNATTNPTILSLYPAPSIIQDPVSLKLNPKENLDLSLMFTSSQFPVQVTWYHNQEGKEDSHSFHDPVFEDVLEEPDDGFTHEGVSHYYKSTVQEEDEGTYFAVVSSPSGSAVSTKVTVKIKNPVKIISVSEDRVVTHGQTVDLTVVVAGSPPYQYQWVKDGSALSETPTTTSNTTILLEIKNVTVFTTGSYELQVWNSAGRTHAHPVVIFFPSAPEIVLDMEDKHVKVDEGETLVFEVEATTNTTGAEIWYQWMKDGKKLTGETKTKLVLKDLTPDDGGRYNCIVWDDGGSVVSSTTIVAVGKDAPIVVFCPADGVWPRTEASQVHNVAVMRKCEGGEEGRTERFCLKDGSWSDPIDDCRAVVDNDDDEDDELVVPVAEHMESGEDDTELPVSMICLGVVVVVVFAVVLVAKRAQKKREQEEKTGQLARLTAVKV